MKIKTIKKGIVTQLKKLHTTFDEYTDKQLTALLFARPNCLRLTRKGYALFTPLFDSYKFNIQSHLTSKHLIALSRHVNFPYFLYSNGTQIVLFGSEEAFLVKLHNNDIKLWLDSLYNISTNSQ